MLITLLSFPLLKNTGGKYFIGKCIKVDSWHHTYFDDKLDVTSQSDWVNFIINYRKFGKRLPIIDNEGSMLMYTIAVIGTSVHVKEATGIDSSAMYLFPQIRKLDETTNKVEPALTYNKKYIWPYLKKR